VGTKFYRCSFFFRYEYVRKDINKYHTSVIVKSINIGTGVEKFMISSILTHHYLKVTYNNEILTVHNFLTIEIIYINK
jgi:hypothetical protein